MDNPRHDFSMAAMKTRKNGPTMRNDAGHP